MPCRIGKIQRGWVCPPQAGIRSNNLVCFICLIACYLSVGAVSQPRSKPFYHEGTPRKETWFIDGEPAGEFRFEPNRPETVMVQIPYDSYVKDRKVSVVFRNASGPFAAKAGLKLICLDHKKQGGGGQSGGKEASIASKLQIGPNPTRGKLTLNFTLNNPSPVKINLFDLTGRRVALLHNREHSSGRQALTFNLPGKLTSGVYFLIFEAEGRSISRKVVLRR